MSDCRRHDYDLCGSCFKKSGNKDDYVRIDSPMLYHHIMKALHRVSVTECSLYIVILMIVLFPASFISILITFNCLIQKHGGLARRFQAYGQFKPVAEPYNPFTGNPVPLVNLVKLDSRFILDVNVIDGTMMAPSTPFTKIWRMKNNGNVVWPAGTQLVWTDGDDFSSALSVDLEVSLFRLTVFFAADF